MTWGQFFAVLLGFASVVGLWLIFRYIVLPDTEARRRAADQAVSEHMIDMVRSGKAGL